MLSGQTQLRFKNEQALEAQSIKDIQNMLDHASPGTRIENYRIVLGLMFFEIRNTRRVEKLQRVVQFQRFLVIGEDKNQKGCLAAMSLSDGVNPRAIVTHMRGLNDTRGGIPEVEWCTCLQLSGLTRAGRPSKSYWAHRRTRLIYYKELLGQFNDLFPFKDQNWRAIRDVIDSRKHLLYDHDEKHELETNDPDPTHGQNDVDDSDSDDNSDNKFYTYRRPKPEHGLDPADDDDNFLHTSDPDLNDEDLDLGNDDNRPDFDNEDMHSDLDDGDDLSDLDQEPSNANDHPESDQDTLDDEENDEGDNNSPNFDVFGDLDNDMDTDEDLSEVRNARSPSPLIRSQSRNDSPEYISIDDDIDMDMDIDLPVMRKSPIRLKVEVVSPEPRVVTQADRTRLGGMKNPVDMTKDDDGPITDYIDLTEDPTTEVIELDS
ncbi:hypothetical protein E4T39_01424 [Aureobasidium subglaciale]|nr:hypothetical protein E4T39_01424 [Aureobasidium subglaciale]